MKDNYKFYYCSGAGTYSIKTGQGSLRQVMVGTTSAGIIEIMDGTDGGTTNVKIAELKASIGEGNYKFDCSFAQGLYVVCAGASKVTVIYR